VMVEEGILEIYVRGHVRDCHVVDAAYRTDQGQIANGEGNARIGIYSNVGEQPETLKEHSI
jgi:hypothetical protein